ncbi:DUF2247 family protein [Bernardetia sp. OM2101]|uniref:DUF2247 family protein n=1 Tax=Bernardetia sp. OM2101 TaxID=3344876 RepID=UPI0035D02FEC
MINKYLKISWNTLYICLNNEWIDSKETVRLINENQHTIKCHEDLLVDFNLNDDDKKNILDLIYKNYQINEEEGLKDWQNSTLLSIRNSQLTIKEKLIEVANLWAYFNYPNEWRSFIYYISNENNKNINSLEGLYEVFLNYLDQLEIK